MTKDFFFFFFLQINVPVKFTNRVMIFFFWGGVCVCDFLFPFESCLMEVPVKMF